MMSDDKCPMCTGPVEKTGGDYVTKGETPMSPQFMEQEPCTYRSTAAEQLENVKADYKAVRDGRDMLLKGVEHAQQQLADKEREPHNCKWADEVPLLERKLTAANAVVEAARYELKWHRVGCVCDFCRALIELDKLQGGE